jgi:hypothetical protein
MFYAHTNMDALAAEMGKCVWETESASLGRAIKLLDLVTGAAVVCFF